MSTKLLDLEASIQRLTPVLENEGPFDGIMGFSQGAAVASAMVSILLNDTGIKHPAMKFAILFCGARPSCSIFDSIYHGISTPSLRLVGKQHVMVPLDRSMELARAFEHSVVVCHPGNHFIPQGWTYTQSVSRFVQEHIAIENQATTSSYSSSNVLQNDLQKSDHRNVSAMLDSSRRNTPRIRLIRKRSLVKLSSVFCK